MTFAGAAGNAGTTRVYKNRTRLHDRGKAVSVHTQPMNSDQKATLLANRVQLATNAYVANVRQGAQDLNNTPVTVYTTGISLPVRAAMLRENAPFTYQDPVTYQARFAQATGINCNFLVKYLPLLKNTHCVSNPLRDLTIGLPRAISVDDFIGMLHYLQLHRVATYVLVLEMSVPFVDPTLNSNTANGLVNPRFLAVVTHACLAYFVDAERSLPAQVVDMLMDVDMLVRKTDMPHVTLEYGITSGVAVDYLLTVFERTYDANVNEFVQLFDPN
jgi:hypothetical protein